jgi:small subunit ribosomal protein S6
VTRNYELVLVLKPELTDEAQEGFLQKVTRWVTEKGGSVSQTDKWGRKKLAYPLKQFMEGIYVLTRFSAEPTLVREVEKNLRLSEEVLRHLVVKIEE